MTYLLTRASARAAGACYDDERIAELVPSEGLAIQQVAALDIPLADIVWAMIRAMGLPDRVLRLSAVDSARRALSRMHDPHPDSVHAVDVAERHVTGEATDAELAAAWAATFVDAAPRAAEAAARAAAFEDAAVAAWAVAVAAEAAAELAAARAAAQAAWSAARAAGAWAAAAQEEERRAQIATLVRLVLVEEEKA